MANEEENSFKINVLFVFALILHATDVFNGFERSYIFTPLYFVGYFGLAFLATLFLRDYDEPIRETATRGFKFLAMCIWATWAPILFSQLTVVAQGALQFTGFGGYVVKWIGLALVLFPVWILWFFKFSSMSGFIRLISNIYTLLLFVVNSETLLFKS